ncbi:hypothetical protein [Paraliomyxa miuraensis]|uniref:hypothetical protein n=1 Tax=Paraliomyxa miuraensis TaxID=376150 RepID=UPI002251DED6|nr:hypothetical protein [Paraliomyxa miuraensis]MCX4245638.1 hypothetical protein [Paraliomyxa miuraensis]
MRHAIVLGALLLSAALVACTSHEGKSSDTAKEPPGPKVDPKVDPKADPKVDPKPEPTVPTARAVIASVQMIEDCPDEQDNWRPPPPPSTPAVPEPPADEEVPQSAERAMPVAPGAMAPGALADVEPGGEWKQPCTQSTMQVVFSGQGDVTSKVQIQAVKLVDPKSGKEVARVSAREPASWRDGAYQAWDETLAPHQEVKASYELSVPDWSEVEKAMGAGSYGHMFHLELEVKVGDEVQSVRSPQFPREEPHVIVT